MMIVMAIEDEKVLDLNVRNTGTFSGRFGEDGEGDGGP